MDSLSRRSQHGRWDRPESWMRPIEKRKSFNVNPVLKVHVEEIRWNTFGTRWNTMESLRKWVQKIPADKKNNPQTFKGNLLMSDGK